jgi:hypothetical protein
MPGVYRVLESSCAYISAHRHLPGRQLQRDVQHQLGSHTSAHYVNSHANPTALQLRARLRREVQDYWILAKWSGDPVLLGDMQLCAVPELLRAAVPVRQAMPGLQVVLETRSAYKSSHPHMPWQQLQRYVQHHPLDCNAEVA